ncbi:uncharacterized protein LOC128531704 [Clarias gariepinus]|uniref:uncharacterized protein LOC128531704 n=1 Tax=Clarias gariepinus TaxID=13013 RepID=UPI00234CCF92|nr:uncharacterized protein LOC128531704 [Clarias gariepinus]
MTGFGIFILIFSIMYKLQLGRRVTAQSLTESQVSQPDKEISVNTGDSATLQCCVSEKLVGMIAWFKQPNRKQPEMIVKLFKFAGDVFDIEFQNPRFQTKKYSNCFNVIITNVSESDEAMYYCALAFPDIVFADGTYLKNKGKHVTIISETSNPPLYDNSVVCEPSAHRNSTNMNTHEITVLSLGTALGLCALLILCLIYLILRTRKHDKLNSSMVHSSRTKQVCVQINK